MRAEGGVPLDRCSLFGSAAGSVQLCVNASTSTPYSVPRDADAAVAAACLTACPMSINLPAARSGGCVRGARRKLQGARCERPRVSWSWRGATGLIPTLRSPFSHLRSRSAQHDRIRIRLSISPLLHAPCSMLHARLVRRLAVKQSSRNIVSPAVPSADRILRLHRFPILHPDYRLRPHLPAAASAGYGIIRGPGSVLQDSRNGFWPRLSSRTCRLGWQVARWLMPASLMRKSAWASWASLSRESPRLGLSPPPSPQP